MTDRVQLEIIERVELDGNFLTVVPRQIYRIRNHVYGAYRRVGKVKRLNPGMDIRYVLKLERGIT